MGKEGKHRPRDTGNYGGKHEKGCLAVILVVVGGAITGAYGVWEAVSWVL